MSVTKPYWYSRFASCSSVGGGLGHGSPQGCRADAARSRLRGARRRAGGSKARASAAWRDEVCERDLGERGAHRAVDALPRLAHVAARLLLAVARWPLHSVRPIGPSSAAIISADGDLRRRAREAVAALRAAVGDEEAARASTFSTLLTTGSGQAGPRPPSRGRCGRAPARSASWARSDDAVVGEAAETDQGGLGVARAYRTAAVL